jgi:hypothetical protein
LAFAVFFWSYGYKVSLYRVHRDNALRLTVAKLWVDSRGERVVGHALRRISSPPTSAALDLPLFFQASTEIGRWQPFPVSLRSLAPHSALLRPRSPPPFLLCLA